VGIFFSLVFFPSLPPLNPRYLPLSSGEFSFFLLGQTCPLPRKAIAVSCRRPSVGHPPAWTSHLGNLLDATLFFYFPPFFFSRFKHLSPHVVTGSRGWRLGGLSLHAFSFDGTFPRVGFFFPWGSPPPTGPSFSPCSLIRSGPAGLGLGWLFRP